MNESSASTPVRVPPNSMAATVQTLNLPTGLYLLSVRAGSPSPVATAGNFQLPALSVGLGPGVDSTQVEFISGPGTHGTWLFEPGNMLIAKVVGQSATLLLTSVSTSSGQALDISIRRLGEEGAASEADPSTATAKPMVAEKTPDPAHPPHLIGLHLSGHGDVNFSDVEWAGRLGKGTWIEAFSVTPLEFLLPQEIEYKGLTSSGFETPWIQGGAACGTRGMATPIVGFAIRLKGKPASRYDCEYSGYFQSGTIIGPLRNGAPCRSSVSGDPLEGIRFRFVLRSQPAAVAAVTASPLPAPPAPPAASTPAEEKSVANAPLDTPRTVASVASVAKKMVAKISGKKDSATTTTRRAKTPGKKNGREPSPAPRA